MKVCLQITIPLTPSGNLKLPYWEDINYIKSDLIHYCSIKEIDAYNEIINEKQDITIRDNELSDFNIEYTEYDSGLFVQSESVMKNRALMPVILVIDGKNSVLNQLINIDWSEIIADEIFVSLPYGFQEWDKTTTPVDFLRKIHGYQGINPVPGLIAGRRKANEIQGQVLWITGKTLRDSATLAEMGTLLENSKNFFYALSLDKGPQCYLSNINLSKKILEIDNNKSTEESLSYYTKRIAVNQNLDPYFVIPGSSPYPDYYLNTHFISDNIHLRKIILASQILKQWQQNGTVSEGLILNAINSRIITPVTGAVVLETQEQYDVYNLDPYTGDGKSVSMPEIIHGFIWLVLLILLVYLIYKRKIS